MAKKPFHEKKIGKVLTNPIVRKGLGLIPFGIGSTITSIIDKNGTEPGQVDPKKLPVEIMKMIIYAVLIYLALKGSLTWADAEQAKQFIQ